MNQQSTDHLSPNGRDGSSQDDLKKANTLLTPTSALLQLMTGDTTLDLWKLFNWCLISYYWLILADFGQVAPSTYNQTAKKDGPFFPQMMFPDTNDIFVNETLFKIYYSYLRQVLLPIVSNIDKTLAVPEFAPIGPTNRLNSFETSFVRSYDCSERRIKGWVSFLVSVGTANYAMLSATYSAVIFFVG